MIEVQVRFNNIEYSLRILKKKLQKEGVFKTIKDKRHYEKPSDKKTRKKDELKRRKFYNVKNNHISNNLFRLNFN